LKTPSFWLIPTLLIVYLGKANSILSKKVTEFKNSASITPKKAKPKHCAQVYRLPIIRIYLITVNKEGAIHVAIA